MDEEPKVITFYKKGHIPTTVMAMPDKWKQIQ